MRNPQDKPPGQMHLHEPPVFSASVLSCPLWLMLNSFGVIGRTDLILNHCFTFQLLVDLCQGLLQVGPDDEQVFAGNTALDHTTRCNPTASVAYGSRGLGKHRCVLLMLAQDSALESDRLGIRGAKWDFVAAGDWHLSQQSI